MQIRRYKYGTAIASIGREDFENILVPLLPKENTKKIEEEMKQAIKLRKEANSIILKAKSAFDK